MFPAILNMYHSIKYPRTLNCAIHLTNFVLHSTCSTVSKYLWNISHCLVIWFYVYKKRSTILWRLAYFKTWRERDNRQQTTSSKLDIKCLFKTNLKTFIKTIFSSLHLFKHYCFDLRFIQRTHDKIKTYLFSYYVL